MKFSDRNRQLIFIYVYILCNLFCSCGMVDVDIDIDIVRTALPANVNVIDYDVRVEWLFSPRFTRRTPLAGILQQIDTIIDELFDFFFEQEAMQPNDMVAIELNFVNEIGRFARPMFVMTHLRNNPAMLFMEMVAAALQSNSSLLLLVWHLKIHLVKIPVAFGKRKRPYGYECIHNKRSVVRIRSEDKLYVCICDE